MERRELIFSYNNTRCHALIVKELLEDERYIGEMDGFEIWQVRGIFFDQFGFVAVKK